MKSLLYYCLAVHVGFCTQFAEADLKPDDIALVVTRRDAQSRELAEYYAQARGIPDGRIIEIDVPSWDQIAFDQFEKDVAPPIREYLRAHGLTEQVKCLVTMYGLPLRVGDRVNHPDDAAELATLRAELAVLLGRLEAIAREAEQLATTVVPSFTPAPADDKGLEPLARRVEHAGRALETAAAELQLQPQRQELLEAVSALTTQLTGPIGAGATTAPATRPAELALPQLLEQRYDGSARGAAREAARRSVGLFNYARLVQSHIDYLATDATGSALDNELALLWWPAYPRARWLPNPLNPRFRSAGAPKTLMVMRLDAPDPQLVRDLIANSVLAERDGLSGRLVVDSRGIAATDAAAKPDPFGVFDQRLRELWRLAEQGGSIPVKLDSAPAVIPPGTEADVALYCGWYSVRNYVRGMRFSRGAVGFHVASFEMMSLRGENEPGWCRGLLRDGVVATIGPVAEPYLHSFPAPDEFFPLLMTGRLTLAEVYWTTTPLVSWMQTCIGDPLYRPYAKVPAMRPQALPPILRRAIEQRDGPVPQATSAPGR